MIMFRKFFITVLLLPLFVHLHAQQLVTPEKASADFVHINEAYSNTKKLKMDLSYVLYPSYTATVPFENEKGVFMKQNNNTYSELLGITSLSNSKVSVSIDQAEQTIVVTDPPAKKTEIPGAVDFDSLLKKCSSIEYLELEGNGKCYKLRFDNTSFFQYNEIDVFFDGQTFLLNKLNLYFREEVDLNPDDANHLKDHPRLEISYSSIDTAPVFAPGQFSETRYINMAGKNITCTSAYTTYRLINHKLS